MQRDNFDRVFDETKRVLGSLKETLSGYATAGKLKLDVIALEGERTRAQRQLGAFVYCLYKTGRDDPELKQQYLDVLDDIEAKILHARNLAKDL